MMITIKPLSFSENIEIFNSIYGSPTTVSYM